jgi:hypothetical protein
MTTEKEEYKTPYSRIYDHDRVKIPKPKQINQLHDELKKARWVKGMFNSRRTGPHSTPFLAHYEYYIRTRCSGFPETVSVEAYKYACLKMHETASSGGFEAYHEVLKNKISSAETLQACEACMFNRLSLEDAGSSLKPDSAVLVGTLLVGCLLASALLKQ